MNKETIMAPICRHCGGVGQWHKQATGRGWVVVPWCISCDRHPVAAASPAKGSKTTWSPRNFSPAQVACMPERYRQAVGRCLVCGTAGPVEQHHFAPRALFGDEAEVWPMADLCVACHDRWHSLVWPQ